MSEDACPLPVSPPTNLGDVIDRMLSAKRIAIVGLSEDPSRPSHEIGRYLAARGKEIVPVNPTYQTVSGLKCYASLEEIEGPIDLVNVFRRPEFCAEVVRSAIAIGAKGVWLQSGIRNEEAARLAAAGKIDFVQDRCIMLDHMRCKK